MFMSLKLVYILHCKYILDQITRNRWKYLTSCFCIERKCSKFPKAGQTHPVETQTVGDNVILTHGLQVSPVPQTFSPLINTTDSPLSKLTIILTMHSE